MEGALPPFDQMVKGSALKNLAAPVAQRFSSEYHIFWLFDKKFVKSTNLTPDVLQRLQERKFHLTYLESLFLLHFNNKSCTNSEYCLYTVPDTFTSKSFIFLETTLWSWFRIAEY